MLISIFKMLSVFCFHITVSLYTEFSQAIFHKCRQSKILPFCPGAWSALACEEALVLDLGPQLISPTSLHRLQASENTAIEGHRK